MQYSRPFSESLPSQGGESRIKLFSRYHATNTFRKVYLLHPKVAGIDGVKFTQTFVNLPTKKRTYGQVL